MSPASQSHVKLRLICLLSLSWTLLDFVAGILNLFQLFCGYLKLVTNLFDFVLGVSRSSRAAVWLQNKSFFCDRKHLKKTRRYKNSSDENNKKIIQISLSSFQKFNQKCWRATEAGTKQTEWSGWDVHTKITRGFQTPMYSSSLASTPEVQRNCYKKFLCFLTIFSQFWIANCFPAVTAQWDPTLT